MEGYIANNEYISRSQRIIQENLLLKMEPLKEVSWGNLEEGDKFGIHWGKKQLQGAIRSGLINGVLNFQLIRQRQCFLQGKELVLR